MSFSSNPISISVFEQYRHEVCKSLALQSVLKFMVLFSTLHSSVTSVLNGRLHAAIDNAVAAFSVEEGHRMLTQRAWLLPECCVIMKTIYNKS